MHPYPVKISRRFGAAPAELPPRAPAIQNKTLRSGLKTSYLFVVKEIL
jgi:hypothetical protein